MKPLYFYGSHGFNFLQFGSLKAKEGGHLNNLVFADKILWIRAKLFDSWLELAATHCLGDVQIKRAFAALRVIQTEFTNNHFASFGHERTDMISSLGVAINQLLASDNLDNSKRAENGVAGTQSVNNLTITLAICQTRNIFHELVLDICDA